MDFTFNSDNIWCCIGFETIFIDFLKFLYGLIIKLFFTKHITLQSLAGKWALITGATDGIGKAFAMEMASNGINLVLVSRNEKKLNAVETEIKAKHKIETKLITVDFVNDSAESYLKRLGEELKEMKIDVLVNNVGMMADMAIFHQHEAGSASTASNLVKCNIDSINNMTSLILPQMVERKFGVIINLGSAAGVNPIPYFATYCATKSYVNTFTQCLEREYGSKGLVFLCLNPGSVATNLLDNPKTSWTVPTPEKYAKSALSKIGKESVAYGYWPHGFSQFFLNLLPNKITNWMYASAAEELKKAKTD